MKIIVIDSETTGIAKTDNVIELAVFSSNIKNFKDYNVTSETFRNFVEWLHEETSVSRYKPKVPINPRAYEVHNIGLSALHDKPCTSTVTVPENIDYIVGHNISFDIRMLLQSNPELEWLNDVPSICTMELARGIKKNLKIPLPSAKLSELTQHYYPEHTELLVPNAHAAKSDVVNTILIALAMLQHVPGIETWDELFEFQQTLKKVKK